jgi:hypothetical protein
LFIAIIGLIFTPFAVLSALFNDNDDRTGTHGYAYTFAFRNMFVVGIIVKSISRVAHHSWPAWVVTLLLLLLVIYTVLSQYSGLYEAIGDPLASTLCTAKTAVAAVGFSIFSGCSIFWILESIRRKWFALPHALISASTTNSTKTGVGLVHEEAEVYDTIYICAAIISLTLIFSVYGLTENTFTMDAEDIFKSDMSYVFFIVTLLVLTIQRSHGRLLTTMVRFTYEALLLISANN